jgi:hypothetical protein
MLNILKPSINERNSKKILALEILKRVLPVKDWANQGP